MIENFVLNPPKWRKNMKANPWANLARNRKGKPKTAKGRAWIATVKKYRKKGKTFKQISAIWRKGKAANPPNPVNPRVKSYRYTRPKKRVTVKSYWRKNAPLYTLPATGVQNPRKKYKKYKKNAWYMQPRRHSKARKKGWRRWGRNPAGLGFTYEVGPVLAGNPVAVGTYLKPLVDTRFLLQTVLPITGGMTSGLLAIKLSTVGPLARLPDVVKKIGLPIAVGVVGGIGLGLATKRKDLGAKFLAGSLAAILSDLITSPIKSALGIEGLGDEAEEMTEELKTRISKAIKTEVAKAKGTAAFVAEEDLPPADEGVSAFVETEALPTEESEIGAFVTEEELPLGGPGVGNLSLDEFIG